MVQKYDSHRRYGLISKQVITQNLFICSPCCTEYEDLISAEYLSPKMQKKCVTGFHGTADEASDVLLCKVLRNFPNSEI